MPYPGEKASRLGHVEVARNAAVKSALQRWTVTSGTKATESEVEALSRPLAELHSAGDAKDIEFAITVDGSDTEVEATREHPTVKVGYLRVAGSMIRLDTFRELANKRYIDPREVRSSHSEYSFDAALPGSQLALPGQSGVDTWRRELTWFLESARFDSTTDMTLADGLRAIHGPLGAPAEAIPLRKCPNCDEKASDPSSISVGISETKCSFCNGPLFLSDVLRTYEEYKDEGSNFTALGRVMTASERLMTLCYIDFFANSAPEVLRHTLFITDGPLALMGPLAPLKRRVQSYLSDVAQKCESLGFPGPLMVGIEKSGAFVEHANLIYQMIEPGSVMMLTNGYINKVLGKAETHYYGIDEFYGRRFIYRTTAGEPLVISVLPKPGIAPYERGDDGLARVENWESYPTLSMICAVLDSLRTRMYKNAVIPVALAHSAAALPLGVGRSVLTMMAQQNVPGLKLQVQAVKPPSYYKR
jgi:hypothetical protein